MVRKKKICTKAAGLAALIISAAGKIRHTRYSNFPRNTPAISIRMLITLAKVFNPGLAYRASGRIRRTSGMDLSE